jgi:hypothetical protein
MQNIKIENIEVGNISHEFKVITKFGIETFHLADYAQLMTQFSSYLFIVEQEMEIIVQAN